MQYDKSIVAQIPGDVKLFAVHSLVGGEPGVLLVGSNKEGTYRVEVYGDIRLASTWASTGYGDLIPFTDKVVNRPVKPGKQRKSKSRGTVKVMSLRQVMGF